MPMVGNHWMNHWSWVVWFKETDIVGVVQLLSQLYECTIWMLTKCIKKNLDGNYRKILCAVLNKYWNQHSTKLQLYGHLPPISQTILVKQTRHTEHCRRRQNEIKSNVFLRTPARRCASVDQLARSYIYQVCENTRSSLESLPWVMNDKDGGQKRVKELHDVCATWWWWWWWW